MTATSRLSHGRHDSPVFEKWGSALLNLVFPPTCVTCGRIGAALCDQCAQLATPVGDAICCQCGRIQQQRIDRCPTCSAQTEIQLVMVRAATLHITPIRECIHALKYDNRPELAQPLARYLVAAFHSPEWQSIAANINAVMPVPIHPERRAERGYNQAELLAQHFCRGARLKLETDMVRRTRHTRQQVGLNAQERQENVADAFQTAISLGGQTVLLVDDVYTTGATLRSCADAVMASGARAVYGLALALPAHTPGGHHF